MQQERELEDDDFPYWIEFYGQMERKLKALQSTLAGRTEFNLGSVFSYERSRGEYLVILNLKRKEKDIGESVDFTLVAGELDGRVALRLKLSMNDYGPGTGVAYTDDPNLQADLTTDVAEVRRRIRELDIEKLADFISGELLKVVEKEPKGIHRFFDRLLTGCLTCGIALALYGLIALTWACPPLKRWILLKNREFDTKERGLS
jgi:hypothetical protein